MIAPTTFNLRSHLDHHDGPAAETTKSRRSHLERVAQFAPRARKIPRAAVHIPGFATHTRAQGYPALSRHPGTPFAELASSSTSLTGRYQAGGGLTAGRRFTTRTSRLYL
jgi:hypothetical protein